MAEPTPASFPGPLVPYALARFPVRSDQVPKPPGFMPLRLHAALPGRSPNTPRHRLASIFA